MDNLSGFYRGTVVSRADPLKAGRVQVKVMPQFSNVADGDLPWAVPADPLMGGTPGVGSSFIPAPGAIIWCFFEACDWRYPVYFAAAPSMLNNTPDLPVDSKTNYPWRKVYRSESGTEILIDDTAGSTLFKILMANGFYVQVDNAGNQTENIPNNLNVTIGGTATVNITGNATLTAQANLTANISGNLDATVNGTSDLTLTGAAQMNVPANLTITGNTIIIGDLTLEGDMTTLAGGGTGSISTVGPISSQQDVTAESGSISLSNHIHTGVQSGGDDTGPPVG